MLVAGVDGVRSAWIVALVDADGHVDWVVRGSAAEVLDVAADCVAVGVDVPLGLPTDGHRPSERAARARLGKARSSVFFTPVRAVLDCETYGQACAVSREVSGKAISLQTWGIVPKIRDWDRARPPDHVVETHPELSFRAMAPDCEFTGKKTPDGAAQRTAATSRWLDVHAALTALPHGVPQEDALDALACAWSARRFAHKEHELLADTHVHSSPTGRPHGIVI